ncbi:MAG: M24 family metallopeptidase [Chlamydiae bacterium]|nr:M24 family metallopeptidase [Chlamydiota bacterium]
MAGQSNLFYLTGYQISSGDFWITPDEGYLFVDDRYVEMIPFARKAKEEREFVLSKKKNLTAISSSLPHSTYIAKKELVHDVIDFDPVLFSRITKEEGEVKLMQQAANLTREAIDYIKKELKEGVIEKEIAWLFERYVREKGADGLSFSPIIAFGANSSFPHYRSGETKLKKDDAVLIDVGIKMAGYASDMTRSFAFGKSEEFYQQAHDAVQSVHDRLFQTAEVGMEVKEVQTLCDQWLKDAGFGKFIRHSVGHFLGLDVHEGYSFKSASNQVLEEFMTFTIEPGLYFPSHYGIRIEDAFVVTKKGLMLI